MKSGCPLVGGGESKQGRVLVKRAKECEAHRGSRAADAIVIAGINGRWRGRILASESVRDDHGRMTGEVGKDKLGVIR